MKRGTITFLKGFIFIVGIVILAMCAFWLPGVAKIAAEMNPEYAYLRYPVLVGLYMTAIPFFLALHQAVKILRYIERKNAFSNLAVISLKYIKNYALIIISLYVIGLFLLVLQHALHPGLAVIGAAIIFAALVISFFAAVLQELLRSALALKLENDLTI